MLTLLPALDILSGLFLLQSLLLISILSLVILQLNYVMRLDSGNDTFTLLVMVIKYVLGMWNA